VWAEINGTLEGTKELTIEDEGELWLWSHARTGGMEQGKVEVEVLNVRAGGKMEALSAADLDALMKIQANNITVSGNGYFRTNNIYINSTYLDIDLAGVMHADFSGEAPNSGTGAGLNKGTFHLGGSGGGHGGRGGPSRYGYYMSLAYDSTYTPTKNGSGGGGDGGRGGGVFRYYFFLYTQILY
jgi:hypothetical protein